MLPAAAAAATAATAAEWAGGGLAGRNAPEWREGLGEVVEGGREGAPEAWPGKGRAAASAWRLDSGLSRGRQTRGRQRLRRLPRKPAGVFSSLSAEPAERLCKLAGLSLPFAFSLPPARPPALPSNLCLFQRPPLPLPPTDPLCFKTGDLGRCSSDAPH